MNKLVKYLSVLLRWRKFVFWNGLAMVGLAALISFVVPKRYTAIARILPPSENDPLGMSSILGGGLSARGLSRMRLGSMLGSGTPSDLMVGILGSRTVVSHVVERCSIIKVYRIRRNSIERAVKHLRKMTGLIVGDDGIVAIAVQAKTPELAARAANCYVEELDGFLRNSNMSQGRSTRLFLEKRLGEVDADLSAAQESLRAFQELHRTVTVDEETKAAVETYAKLKSQLYVKTAELGAIEQYGSADNPYVIRVRAEVDAFRRQIRGLERGDSGSGYGVGFAVSFESLPGVGAEFARRYRDVVVQEELYGMLYQQYEYARVLEARDTPALTVLDFAVPPERRSYPRRALFVVVGFLLSLIAGAAFIFLMEYLRHTRETRPDEYRSWESLLRQFRGILWRSPVPPSQAR